MKNSRVPSRQNTRKSSARSLTNGLRHDSRRLRIEALEQRQLLSLTPQLLKDIGVGDSSRPSSLVEVGATVFFAANDGTMGSELWKSDGTTAGTVLVKDIVAGSSGAGAQNLTNVNGTLFFIANDGTNGAELWKSDGTTAGTVLVKDIRTGSGIFGVYSSTPQNLTNVNGTLFFQANDGTNGYELWKSDGTTAGTVLVKDIRTGSGSSSPQNLANVNGTLFFQANDGTVGPELWKSDGTTAGTVLVKDIRSGSGSSAPQNLTNVNGTLFFQANDGAVGAELWKSDGTTAGTARVKDIRPGSIFGNGGSYPQNLTNVNGTLFFAANDFDHGNELWKSDGTTAGTVLVKDIGYLPNVNYTQYNSNPQNLTNVNGTLFFRAVDASYLHGSELWKSDGTLAGTVLVKDIRELSGSSTPKYLTNVNGTLFFKANDGTSGYELWKSDGTTAGTVLVKDILAGPYSSNPPYGTALTNVNGTLFFTASDRTYGTELWNSDGTTAGTALVKDINFQTQTSSGANRFTDVSGTTFFVAGDPSGSELWKTDGTSAGTVLVKDIYPGSQTSSPRYLTNVNGTLFFTASDGTNGTELWKSDGTTAGTVLVRDIFSGSVSSIPRYLTNVNGTLFFQANDATYGIELWKSDGTAAGTVLVKDIWGPGFSSSPRYLTNVNGTLFFTANDGTVGRELWKSDGTLAGTVLVKDIRTGGLNSSYPKYLTNVNGTLYFSANDGTNGVELWKSDGTPAGTVLVKDILAGSSGSGTSSLTNVNGTLFFTAFDGTNGGELWKSDGTLAGTVLVKDIRTGSGNSNPFSLTNVNGTLFFQANDGTNAYELWKSDGTGAGTVLVKDIRTGSGSSTPKYLTNVNGTLYFSANDGTNGVELWKSDGTTAGTVLVKDILAGINGSTPKYLTNANGTLFFSADNGIVGREPWVLRVSEPALYITPSTVSQNEGNSGGTSFVFTVNLSPASTLTVSVEFSTADGTATTINGDYVATTGTLIFTPGQTVQFITVPVQGDTTFEPDEDFTVNLSSPVNAPIETALATGVIQNDDLPGVTLSPATVTHAEGDSGTTPYVFTVTLSAVSGQTVTVAYDTANGTATLADGDYAAADDVLTFAPGETSKLVTVLANGDTTNEADEDFTLALSGPTNATLGTTSATGTITNDDAVPSLSLSPTTVTHAEGDSGTTPYVFTVTLSAVSGQTVTVAYDSANGTATLADGDYAAANDVLTFALGETSKLVTVLANGDTTNEADEDFTLTLSSPTNATLVTSSATGTITNDDPVPSLASGRFLFYNQSSWDGGADSVTTGDDSAIATDKTAYIAGSGSASSSALSSFSRGINGVMVDLLGGGAHTAIDAGDFIFKTGNDNTPSGWATAPAPVLITVRTGAGVSSSDRVEILWGANAVKKAWLEVEVLNTAHTGLASTDVFYWGNMIGDSNLNFATSGADSSNVLANPTGAAAITNTRDHNRSKVVNGTDSSLALANVASIVRINLSAGSMGPAGGGDGGDIEAGPAASPASGVSGDSGVASALALTSASSGSSSTSGHVPAWLLTRLREAHSSRAATAAYFQHLADEQRAPSRPTHAKVDRFADVHNLDDDWLESLATSLRA